MIMPIGDAGTRVSKKTPSANAERRFSRRRMGSGAAKTRLALGKEVRNGMGSLGGVMELTALGWRST